MRQTTRWEYIICFSIFGGILLGILIDINSQPIIYEARAQEPVTVEKPVMIEVRYEREGIIRRIKETFPEQPELAVKVFSCESQLNPKAIGPTDDWGLTQVNAPSWDKQAKRLGYSEYKTEVDDNLKMARYIYKHGGWDNWTCYNRQMY